VQQSIKNTHVSHIISPKSFTPFISKYTKSIETYGRVNHSQT